MVIRVLAAAGFVMGLDGGLVQVWANFRSVFGTTREVERRVFRANFRGICALHLRKIVKFIGAALWIWSQLWVEIEMGLKYW